jgi:hypothetical protein
MDQETWYYYYGYRLYCPELGRWINRDPIQETGDLNLYRFVFNTPVINVDYLGLSPLPGPKPGPAPTPSPKTPGSDKTNGKASVPQLTFVAGESLSVTGCAMVAPGVAICVSGGFSIEAGECCDSASGSSKYYGKFSGKVRAFARAGVSSPVSVRYRKPVIKNLKSCPSKSDIEKWSDVWKLIDGGFFVRATGGWVYGSCEYSFRSQSWSCGAGFTHPSGVNIDVGGFASASVTLLSETKP